MEDWEREYEEDRRRMAAGGDVGGRRRQLDDDDNPFAEQSAPRNAAPSYEPPSIAISENVSTRGPKDMATEDAKIEALYAQYRDDEPVRGATNESAASNIDPSQGDARVGLHYVTIPQTYQAKFGAKMGNLLFFCEGVKGYFKGFFSPNECQMVCFATKRCLYLGDESTGEIVLGRPIPMLKEVQILGDTGVGLRGTDKGVDWYLTVPVNREQFVKVITKLAASFGTPLNTRTLSVEGEKSFKKEIRYTDRKEATWTLEEDPRTGLQLLEVPEQHKVPYAPLVPKMLHWFGGVFHIVKDWKKANIQERRGCWLTPTALFLCKPTGPQVDGRDVTRCMGIEFMVELIDGPEGQLGIIPNPKEGPQQLQLALNFDSPEMKRDMMEAIQAAYRFRIQMPLKVTKTLSLDAKMKIEKEKDTKPHLFVMKTRADLYGLLRGKVK